MYIDGAAAASFVHFYLLFLFMSERLACCVHFSDFCILDIRVHFELLRDCNYLHK